MLSFKPTEVLIPLKTNYESQRLARKNKVPGTASLVSAVVKGRESFQQGAEVTAVRWVLDNRAQVKPRPYAGRDYLRHQGACNASDLGVRIAARRCSDV